MWMGGEKNEYSQVLVVYQEQLQISLVMKKILNYFAMVIIVLNVELKTTGKNKLLGDYHESVGESIFFLLMGDIPEKQM